jgi:hypothetical protein
MMKSVTLLAGAGLGVRTIALADSTRRQSANQNPSVAYLAIPCIAIPGRRGAEVSI